MCLDRLRHAQAKQNECEIAKSKRQSADKEKIYNKDKKKQ